MQRAYEEGEAELLADEEGEDGAADALDIEKDEKTFLLDQSLHFRSEIRDNGEAVFAWQDLSGDPGDLFEFICDETTQPGEVGTFEIAAIECQYERKFRKPKETATDKQLQQFDFTKQPIPAASPLASPTVKTLTSAPMKGQGEKDKPAASAKGKKAIKEEAQRKPPTDEPHPTTAPPSAVAPTSKETLAKERAELHLFDFESGSFMLQDPSVVATVSETGNWQYWLQITGKDRDWLGQRVVADLNPVFNFEYLSFIFNHYTDDGSAYSWLLRFKDQDTEERFQDGLMRALWEQLNETKWKKIDKDDQQYVLDAFQDLTMEDAPLEEEVEEEVEEEADGQRSEHYDSDESEDDVKLQDNDGNVNSKLAVGYKHDRSFVIRGSKIGVFKHTPNNNLEFSTNISKVETPKGKLFSPSKVMLHSEDQNMILQNKDNPNSLYRMDLEYGKVVDEWKIHDDVPVKSFAPDKVRIKPRGLLHKWLM